MAKPQCKGTNQDGAPCSAQPVRPSGYCYWHDEELATVRAANNRRGGRHRSKKARAQKLLTTGLASLGGINELMKVALWETYLGDLDPGVFTAMATGVRAIKDISIAAEYGEEVAALRDELARLSVERSA